MARNWRIFARISEECNENIYPLIREAGVESTQKKQPKTLIKENSKDTP